MSSQLDLLHIEEKTEEHQILISDLVRREVGSAADLILDLS